jgi:hypothetical protein
MITINDAGTTYPNSPESDLRETVLHTVNGTNEKGQKVTVQLYARDPLDAIERARKVNQTAWEVVK